MAIKTSRICIALLLITFTLGSFAHAQSREDVEKANKLLNEGNAAMTRGEFNQAAEIYTKALELLPNEPIFLMNRGAAHLSAGQKELALTDLNQALSLSDSLEKKGAAQLNFNLGTLYQMKGDYMKSLEMFNKAIELDPGVATFYLNRGNTYRLQGKNDLALADYNKSIETSPNAMAFYNRATVALSNRDYPKAIADYNTAIELDPKFSEALHNRGLAHMQNGSIDLAIDDFTKAIGIKPHGLYYMNRGVAYNQKKNYTASVADLTKTIEFYPLWRVAYLQRALSYRRLGKLELSGADVKRAKELEKENFEPFKGANVIYKTDYQDLETPENEQP